MKILQSLFTTTPDSVTIAKVEAQKAAFIEKVSTSSPSELLEEFTEAAIMFGLKLLAAAVIFFVGRFLIKWVRSILKKRFAARKTDATIASFALSLVNALLWIVVIIIAVGILGVKTTSIAALFAAGGMAIGMALSGTLQNFAGGIMILAFRPFRAGDYIEAQGFGGKVKEVNITSTKIHTPDNKEIILPNGALSNGVINNYSRQKWRRIEFVVGLEYGCDAEAAKEALLEIANSEERVAHLAQGAPAEPFVGLKALSASSVDFTLRVWVKSDDYWPVYFKINEMIYISLPQKGLDFPFPQVTVNMAGKRN